MVSLKPKGVTDPESDIEEDIERLLKSKWTSKEVSIEVHDPGPQMYIFITSES